MTHIAIVAWSADGRPTKYQPYATLAEAQAHGGIVLRSHVEQRSITETVDDIVVNGDGSTSTVPREVVTLVDEVVVDATVADQYPGWFVAPVPTVPIEDCRVVDGALIEDPRPPPTITAEDVDKAKARVALFADGLAAKITGPVPDAERASWATKEAAARAHQAGTASALQTEMLNAEASLTGEDLATLTGKIIANADSYIKIAGMIAGQRRATLAAIDALAVGTATVADLEAVLATARVAAESMLAALTA